MFKQFVGSIHHCKPFLTPIFCLFLSSSSSQPSPCSMHGKLVVTAVNGCLTQLLVVFPLQCLTCGAMTTEGTTEMLPHPNPAQSN